MTNTHGSGPNLVFVVVAIACQILVSDLGAYAQNRTDDQPFEKDFAAVAPCVVRVAYTERGHSGVGVIISPEGLLLLQGAPHLFDKELFITLAGDRVAKGKLLGWSQEWNLSVAKITEAGPWPTVSLNPDAKAVEVGESLFQVGYTLRPDGWSADPVQRNVTVVKAVPKLWFSTENYREKRDGEFTAFRPVFDHQGHLTGMLGAMGAGQKDECTFLYPERIQFVLDLIESGAGQNLDEYRLKQMEIPGENKRPYHVQARESGRPRGAKEQAIASTVRICLAEDRDKYSGVIISEDGFVASHGHANNLPGERVRVQLPDGRDAAAKYLGTNPVTDLALLKITDEGPWPFSPLCDSSRLPAETPCWIIGYPGTRQERTPFVRETQVVPPEGFVSLVLPTDPKGRTFSGDSGAGVFDEQGRLLAISVGKDPEDKRPVENTRIETLRLQWDLLAPTTK